MKTVYDNLGQFMVVGVKPGVPENDDVFELLTEASFEGRWKVIAFYPKDFTGVCPTEIIAYDGLNDEFEKRNAVLLTGSTDSEYCKLAWRNSHDGLRNIRHWQFADTRRDNLSLSKQLGVFFQGAGAALRATFIVDPANVIQHVTVNNLAVGRSANEALRVLDALQTGQLCACNRQPGEATL